MVEEEVEEAGRKVVEVEEAGEKLEEGAQTRGLGPITQLD